MWRTALLGCTVVALDPCVRDAVTNKCQYCSSCAKGTNDGWRSPAADTLFATRLAPGTPAPTIDASLDDAAWAATPMSRRYANVPFAQKDGKVVVFENNGDGASWDGTADFGFTASLAFDSDNLYLAVEVTDDMMDVGSLDAACYKQGLQLGFEVGGAASLDASGASLAGELQAKRSKDVKVSRLDLLNFGLAKGEAACRSAPAAAARASAAAPAAPAAPGKLKPCCVQYEANRNNDGWQAGGVDAAVRRDEAAKKTYYEASISKFDLLGNNFASLQRWGVGLRLGFSLILNDADKGSAQEGWAGYYPYALVRDYRGGEKRADKAGVLQLDGSFADFKQREALLAAVEAAVDTKSTGSFAVARSGAGEGGKAHGKAADIGHFLLGCLVTAFVALTMPEVLPKALQKLRQLAGRGSAAATGTRYAPMVDDAGDMPGGTC